MQNAFEQVVRRPFHHLHPHPFVALIIPGEWRLDEQALTGRKALIEILLRPVF
jgi:hypothetical protein